MPKKSDESIDQELLKLTGGVQKQQTRKPVVPLKKRLMASAMNNAPAKRSFDYESSDDEGNESSDSWGGSDSENDADLSDDSSSDDEPINMEGLSEVQREQIAMAQFEKQERKKQRREFKAQARARKQNKKQLRSRKKQPTSSDSAISHLKKKRQQQERRREEYVDVEDSDEDEEMAEAEYEGGAEYGGEYEESERPITLEDVHQVQVSRTQIEKYHNRKIFRKKIIGLYARVALELRNAERVYRVYEITGVKEGNRWYNIDKLKLKTNLVLTLKYGTSERDFLMKYISNNPFTQSEFERWIMTLKGARTPPPTLQYLQELRKQKQEMEDSKLTHEEITEMAKKNKERLQAPINAAVERQELEVEIAEAQRANDDERVKELQARVVEVTRSMTKKLKAVTKYTETIDQINERTRQMNEDIINQAQQNEGKSDDYGGTDPFSRRKTEQTLIFAAPDELEESAPVVKEKKFAVSATDRVADLLKNESVNVAVVVPDVAEEHNFEVSIDIDPLKTPSKPAYTVPLKASTPAGTSATGAKKKRLSLSDYRKRKGL